MQSSFPIFNIFYGDLKKSVKFFLSSFLFLVLFNSLIMDSERGRAKAWPRIVYILSSGGLSVSALGLFKTSLTTIICIICILLGKGIASFTFLSLLACASAILFVVAPLRLTYFFMFQSNRDEIEQVYCTHLKIHKS